MRSKAICTGVLVHEMVEAVENGDAGADGELAPFVKGCLCVLDGEINVFTGRESAFGDELVVDRRVNVNVGSGFGRNVCSVYKVVDL